MANVLMKCGCVGIGLCHSWHGIEYDPPVPTCITHDCIDIAEKQPNLNGRIARCHYKECKKYLAIKGDTHYGEIRSDGRSYAPSSLDLPFFVYKPGEEYDEYVCGCMGWD